ncbi:hypothetical protein GR160_17580 [Flavobacterium sp. Sd200]|uniref:carboxypeptidase-like regulatory domain-containing protein n=1 Tax=Flavobacterium sp. Sd200 TaxID=2692211 RepID=UPI00136E08E5|nr:carboxypeptidase-like regulatory domain-containing protein [Flavobacterium sp. Sd200]MXN93040.1 hypothetical protein [Flavobacterium sp. Sd200]
MKKILQFTAILFFVFSINAAAQTVTAKVIDAQNQPVPYVSIQIGPTYGVMSNEEGIFVITVPEKPEDNKIIFSSIGYETLTIPLADLKAGTYVLKEQVNVLDEVFITNKKYTPIEILTKVKENAPQNYASQTAKQTFFLRNSHDNKLIDSKFEMIKSSLEKKSTLKDLNKELEEIAKKKKGQRSTDFSEAYGFLYTQNGESKLVVEKAVELKNKEKDVAGDQNSKLIEVIKKHLEPDATYKVRSGILPVDDSLKVSSPAKDVKEDVKTASLRSSITALSEKLNKFYTNEELDFLTEFKRYTYALEGFATFNGETIYIIDFKPAKGSAHYYGKLYVNAADFALVKLDYNLVDGEYERKVNLKLVLGLKMIQDGTKVSATFAKNEAGQYAVNFVKKQMRNYMYINRSLKFTKNKVSKDEETRMLKIEFLMEVDVFATNELFIIDRKPATAAEFAGITEKANYNVNYISKFDPAIWKDYNVLAPVEAIKNYQ